jgi:hypothetical protein
MDQPPFQGRAGDIAGTTRRTMLSTRPIRVGGKFIIDGVDGFQLFAVVLNVHRLSLKRIIAGGQVLVKDIMTMVSFSPGSVAALQAILGRREMQGPQRTFREVEEALLLEHLVTQLN